jgi:hypothetical protein
MEEYMSKDFTPTVTVDLLKCAEGLKGNNDINLEFFKKSLTPLENPLRQFFLDFPRSSIHLTIGGEKLIIAYDEEQKKTRAKDSLGNEISYDAVLQDDSITGADKLKNDYTNFENCLKSATKGKITDKQIEYIANNFHQAVIAVQGFNLLDQQSLSAQNKTLLSTSYHDTLHIKFDEAGQMELNLRAALPIYDIAEGKRNIAGYSEYRGVVDKKGSLLSSETSIQGDGSSFLFEPLNQYCTFLDKMPSIKTNIENHIINTNKQIEDVCLVQDYQGKTIAEEICKSPFGVNKIEKFFIDKMVQSLCDSFEPLGDEKLTPENKENIKNNLNGIIEPFSKIPELSRLIKKLDVDAIVRRGAREYKGLKQGFKSKMKQYFRKVIDLFKRNKKIEGIVKTSDVVKALKKYVSTQNHSHNVNKKTSGKAITR